MTSTPFESSTCTVLALGTFSFSAGFMSVKKPIVLDTANLFGFEAAYPFPALDFDGLIKLMDFLGCALALAAKLACLRVLVGELCMVVTF